jgi:hypothetical protein
MYMEDQPATAPATPAREPRARIAATVPYPDGEGGYIPYSKIEFSLYDEQPGNLDEGAALAALTWFHSVVIQHYQYTADVRKRRLSQREQAEKAGRPAAALVPDSVSF